MCLQDCDSTQACISESDCRPFVATHGADSAITEKYVLQKFADARDSIREKQFSELRTPDFRTLRSSFIMVEVLNVDVNRWWLSGRRRTATLIKSLVSNEIDVRVRVPDEILQSSEAERVLLDMHRVGLIFFSFNLRYVQLLSEAGRDELKSRYHDELREL